MQRAAALLITLTAAVTLVAVPAAEATSASGMTVKASCAISGTVTFSAGRWDVSPGVIDCRGLGYGFERILGRGSFTGSGSYTAVSDAENCLPQLGSGTVDYWVPTTERDLHVVESTGFSPSGAGAFTTPSLRGTFQIAHYDGNCLTNPHAGALFLAEVTLLRGPRRNV